MKTIKKGINKVKEKYAKITSEHPAECALAAIAFGYCVTIAGAYFAGYCEGYSKGSETQNTVIIVKE